MDLGMEVVREEMGREVREEGDFRNEDLRDRRHSSSFLWPRGGLRRRW